MGINWYRRIKTAAEEMWRQPFEQFAPYPFTKGEFNVDDPEHLRVHHEYRDKKRQWQQSVAKALSYGQLDSQTAEQRGYHNLAGEKWLPLPQRLYHVTTNKTGVFASHLKSRSELSQSSGKGLGGGDEQTISFTEDLNIAQGIYRSMLEARDVAAMKMTPQQMLQEAAAGTGANQPYIDGIFKHYDYNGKQRYTLDNPPEPIRWMIEGIRVDGPYFPESEQEWAKKHGEGWLPYGEKWPYGDEPLYQKFYRKMTPEERRDQWFSLYKAYAAFRENAGGHLDPLFFGSDINGLAQTPVEEIAILVCQPKPGAMGYRVSALGEWRTFAGDSVSVVNVIQ